MFLDLDRRPTRYREVVLTRVQQHIAAFSNKAISRIKTSQLLERIASGEFETIKLAGLQDGSFYMMIEIDGTSLIHENADGSVKQYQK